MLDRFIQQLQSNLKLEEGSLGREEDTFTLTLDPNLHISLRENPNSGITLYTKMTSLPSKSREDFLVKAMSANLFGQETGEYMLGLDREGKQLVLVGFCSMQLNYKAFYDVLEDFANYAAVWREEIMEFEQQA